MALQSSLIRSGVSAIPAAKLLDTEHSIAYLSGMAHAGRTILALERRVRELEAEVARLEARLARLADTEQRIDKLEAQLAKVADDPWEDIVIRWLDARKDRRHTTASLLRAVGVRPPNREAEVRIRAIMSKLDWQPGLVPSYTGRVRGYIARHAPQKDT